MYSPVIRTVLCVFVINFLCVCTQSSNLEDLDSVTTDAADLNDATRKNTRDTKQILLQANYAYPLYNLGPPVPLAQPLANPSLLAATGACYTSKGTLGTCVSFKECYPHLKMGVQAGIFDGWGLGMYDTCSYFLAQGQQTFGVCCSSIPKPLDTTSSSPVEIDSNNTSIQPNNFLESARIPNWPPPLPTHPPDHTIPPLPTHPPSPGFPVPATTTISSKPTKVTTKPIASKPTSKTTTTTASYELGTAACGAKNGFQDQGKIVGGHNADLNEWPWIAALFVNGRQFCGGSLIDKIHILSAAHCVAHMTSWDVAKLTVRLGDHNIKTNSEVNHIEKRVKRVVRHRGFDSRTLYNDISILTLDSPVQFSNVIRPICLPSAGGRDLAGSTGTVIGWGSIRESGPQPAVLQEVNIPIWSNRDCKQKYGAAAPGGIVEHMVCAGQANRDSCSGDSGGPLMVNHGKWTQIGIVSWGIGCGKGQYPGVYTRVQSFLPWIMKNLNK
ncbi:serine protease 44-like [Sitophilus oryzae]|uniref:Phenoloxidase-activating factor 2 n=2 Tax=Sitophilus oryzae TaxID=7048 RepID=A0A6J2YM07_SITOR|nr:serine protease 44-like [Sitophilus oryzae]